MSILEQYPEAMFSGIFGIAGSIIGAVFGIVLTDWVHRRGRLKIETIEMGFHFQGVKQPGGMQAVNQVEEADKVVFNFVLRVINTGSQTRSLALRQVLFMERRARFLTLRGKFGRFPKILLTDPFLNVGTSFRNTGSKDLNFNPNSFERIYLNGAGIAPPNADLKRHLSSWRFVLIEFRITGGHSHWFWYKPSGEQHPAREKPKDAESAKPVVMMLD